VVVDNDELGFVRADVNQGNRSRLLDDGDWECVVQENAGNDTVLQADQQRLFLRWATDNLDVPYLALKDPFLLQNPRKREQLNLLLEHKHQILRRHKQVVAVNALVDLLVGFIFHVEGIVSLDCVDDDLLRKLHR